MPLQSGSSREVISHNISELTHHGSHPRPRDQIIAIALSNARRHPRADGGFAPLETGFAPGGVPHIASPAMPWFAKQQARGIQTDAFHPKGLFHSDVAGRTDRIPRSVPADSFVVPADVVSGLGQGNTLAGAKIMNSIIGGGGHGVGPYGSAMPRRRADGGSTPEDGLSHVLVAGGEYLVHRDDVARIGNRMRRAGKSKKRSDVEAGHEALRGMVERVRKHQKEFLRHAPKPKA